jgi:oligoribonuclease
MLRRLQEPISPRLRMDDPNKRMVWIDLEMTGLDLERERIIEIATIITDSELNIIAEGPNLAISVPEELIEGMDDWNTRHHFGSGLINRVRNESVSLEDAEQQTLEFIKQYVPKNTAPLCGNSVWNDRQFLVKEMPTVTDYLHYRMVDVSTIKELARRWYPGLPKFEKKGTHLALDDIRESVFELVHFRELLFIDRP